MPLKRQRRRAHHPSDPPIDSSDYSGSTCEHRKEGKTPIVAEPTRTLSAGERLVELQVNGASALFIGGPNTPALKVSSRDAELARLWMSYCRRRKASRALGREACPCQTRVEITDVGVGNAQLELDGG